MTSGSRSGTQTCEAELRARILALEAELSAFAKLMDERDRRYEQRADAQDNAVKASLLTSKEAVNKAEASTERRLETLNELRGVVTDQSQEFARRTEVDLQVKEINTRINAIMASMKTAEGHGGGIRDAIGWIVGVAGVAVAAVAIYFHH